MPGEECLQLLARLVALRDAVADVGPVETGDELTGLVERQPFDDLAPGRGVGRRGQRDARHVRKAFVQHRELAVLGAEVVAPLRYAVGFVDREQRYLRAFGQVQKAPGQESRG